MIDLSRAPHYVEGFGAVGQHVKAFDGAERVLDALSSLVEHLGPVQQAVPRGSLHITADVDVVIGHTRYLCCINLSRAWPGLRAGALVGFGD